MFPTYSVAQMLQAERRAASEYGVSLAQLMDHAGLELARQAVELLAPGATRVAICCGTGNNGGDGYVCGAALLRRGLAVQVVAVSPQTLRPDSLAGAALARYTAAGGVIVEATADLTADQIAADLVIDALLGTGLARPVTGLYAHLIGLINAVPCPVLACDVPSGINADDGSIMGVAVRASRTLTLGLVKRGLVRRPASEYCGDLRLGDIGLPPELVASLADCGSTP